jgi:hypothetical protein
METVEEIVKICDKGQIILLQKIREKEGRAENSGFNDGRL